MDMKSLIEDLSYRVRFGGFLVEIIPSQDTLDFYSEEGMKWKEKVFHASGFQKLENGNIIVHEKYIGQKRIKSQLVSPDMIIDYISNTDDKCSADKKLIIIL